MRRHFAWLISAFLPHLQNKMTKLSSVKNWTITRFKTAHKRRNYENKQQTVFRTIVPIGKTMVTLFHPFCQGRVCLISLISLNAEKDLNELNANPAGCLKAESLPEFLILSSTFWLILSWFFFKANYHFLHW